MDVLDFLWTVDQEHQIGELRKHFDRLHAERDQANWDHRNAKELAEENLELKLRLGLLVRLLITKGVITAPEYAALIAEAHPKS
jgi:hypothetical protein